MDVVRISELRVDAVIGVHDWERRIRQPLVFSLDLGTDIRPAAADDDLAKALDYAAVSRLVKEVASGSGSALIETLAEAVAVAVMERFDVPWLRLELRKPGAVPDAGYVAVCIERGERP